MRWRYLSGGVSDWWARVSRRQQLIGGGPSRGEVELWHSQEEQEGLDQLDHHHPSHHDDVSSYR
ncbi:hypothetical protein KI387_000817, partial [Taxus chinensis]